MKKISIVVPAYNEEATVAQILKKVWEVKLPWKKEIIVVNDQSTDNTGRIIKDFKKKHTEVIYEEHLKNMGKGAAVLTGINRATGDYVVIQDADLEYDPNDIGRLISAAEEHPEAAIYGSRLTEAPVLFGKNQTPMVLHYFGNRLLSLITTILYGVWLTDMETGYKLFPRLAVAKFKIKARGFEFEPEITAKLLTHGCKIYEIPISTTPRSYNEGKKLNTWSDGWRALATLFKYRFTT